VAAENVPDPLVLREIYVHPVNGYDARAEFWGNSMNSPGEGFASGLLAIAFCLAVQWQSFSRHRVARHGITSHYHICG